MKKLSIISATALFTFLLNTGCHTNPQRPNAKTGNDNSNAPYTRQGESGYNGSGDGIRHNMLNGTGDGLKNANPNQVYTGGSGAKGALPTNAINGTNTSGSTTSGPQAGQTAKPEVEHKGH